jgi:hypothetical protein
MLGGGEPQRIIGSPRAIQGCPDTGRNSSQSATTQLSPIRVRQRFDTFRTLGAIAYFMALRSTSKAEVP